MRVLSAALLLGLSTPLAGCMVVDAREAAQGKAAIVGLTKAEVRMCAGFPTQTVTEGTAEIWSYERAVGGGASVTLPTLPSMVAIPGPSFSQNRITDCRAQMRFKGDRVVEVAYAGKTDVLGALDAACSEIVRKCIGYRPGRAPRSAPGRD